METYFVIPTRAVNGPRGRLPFPTGHIKAADGGATGGQCPDGEVRPGQASFSLEWACAPPLGWWSCSRGRHSLKPSPSPPHPPDVPGETPAQGDAPRQARSGGVGRPWRGAL